MKALITVVALPLLLAAVSAPAIAQDHHHPATTATQAVSAQRWDTDAPLRAGMAQIREAVDALGHYELGHMGQESAVALATRIQQQIAYVVANCKLEPQADADLHVIIAELAASAQALKANPAGTSAIPPMRHALQRYSVQFNDPASPSADEPEEKR